MRNATHAPDTAAAPGQALGDAQRRIALLEAELAALRAREALRRRDLDVVLDLLNRFAQDPRLEAVGDHVLRSVVAQLGVAGAWLWVVDAATGLVRARRACDGLRCGSPPDDAGTAFAATRHRLGRLVLDRGEPVAVRDAARDPRLASEDRDGLAARGVASLLLVPLFHGAEGNGVAVSVDGAPRSWSGGEIQIARTLGHHLTLSIHFDRLAESLHSRAALEERARALRQHMTRLEHANSEIRRTLDLLATESQPDVLVGRLLAAVAAQLQSDTASLWLVEPGEWPPSLALVYRRGQILPPHESGHPLAGRPPPITREEWLAPTLGEVAIHDADDPRDPRFAYLRDVGMAAVVAVPLVLGTEMIGHIGVWLKERRPIGRDHIGTLAALGQQATLAVHLTRLARAAEEAAVVQERNRLAREIHDSLAQTLTAANMHLEVATDSAIDEPERAMTHARKARDLALSGSAEARRSTWAVDPQIATCDDLVAALGRTVSSLSTERTPVTLRVDGAPTPLDGETAAELLRIAQEGLTNAARHAGASDVVVTLSFRADALELQVADNGVGLGPAAGRPAGGLGLTSMRERAQRLGATFRIESTPGRGVIVTTRMAWPRPAGAEPNDCGPRTLTARRG